MAGGDTRHPIGAEIPAGVKQTSAEGRLKIETTIDISERIMSPCHLRKQILCLNRDLSTICVITPKWLETEAQEVKQRPLKPNSLLPRIVDEARWWFQIYFYFYPYLWRWSNLTDTYWVETTQLVKQCRLCGKKTFQINRRHRLPGAPGRIEKTPFFQGRLLGAQSSNSRIWFFVGVGGGSEGSFTVLPSLKRTNIAPENWWWEDSFWGPAYFEVLC